jgi:hypothetical protein
MEKFKQLLEEAQRLTENNNGVLRNVKLIPTPDDVVLELGSYYQNLFKKVAHNNLSKTNRLLQFNQHKQLM